MINQEILSLWWSTNIFYICCIFVFFFKIYIYIKADINTNNYMYIYMYLMYEPNEQKKKVFNVTMATEVNFLKWSNRKEGRPPQ